MEGRSRVLPKRPLHAVLVTGVVAMLAGAGCAGLRPGNSPSSTAPAAETPHTFVFVASAAGEIEVLELDARVGDLTRRSKVNVGAPILSLAGPPRGRLLLASVTSGTTATAPARGAAVVSLSVDPRTGSLRSLGRAGVGGTDPMGAAVDGSGRYVAVANHGSANVSVVPIRHDGRLAEADTFAAGRGASAVGFHPSNTAAFVVNEGAGTISQYSFNPGTGALTPKPGQPLGLPWDSHPRQIRCHPNGRFVYVLNEANQTVSVHAFDDRLGALNRMAFQIASTLPEGTRPAMNRAGSMRLGAGGKFLYVSNRGHDTIAVFAVDGETGELTLRTQVASGGQDPVELTVDPEGAFLIVANQKSRSLATFRVTDGQLEAAGTLSLTAAPRAVFSLRPELEDSGPPPPQQALLP
jgi:6-phosphogluconolactonase